MADTGQPRVEGAAAAGKDEVQDAAADINVPQAAGAGATGATERRKPDMNSEQKSLQTVKKSQRASSQAQPPKKPSASRKPAWQQTYNIRLPKPCVWLTLLMTVLCITWVVFMEILNNQDSV